MVRYCSRPAVLPSVAFNPLPGRDAHAAIAGFVYQVERTILAWLDLPPDTILFCESGEDIDYVAAISAAEGYESGPFCADAQIGFGFGSDR
jgi:hypothetical protein